MFRNILRRNLRQPMAALAVLLLSAVLTAVLGHLHRSGEAQKESFQQAYASVPVFFKVVGLDGSKPKDFTGINGWTLDLMEKDWMEPSLQPYVKELHLRISLQGTYAMYDKNGNPLLNPRWHTPINGTQVTVGVSSTRVAEELTEDWGGTIHWYDGFDESILMSNAPVCLVPESMKHYRQLDMSYHYDYWPTDIAGDLGGSIPMDVQQTFQVVGYYTDPGNSRIYCPYQTLSNIHAALLKPQTILEIGAILNDNTRLAQLREDAAHWFAQPNPLGTPTPWGMFGYENYLYALDIDDAMLTGLEQSLQSSLRLNWLVTTAIWIMVAAAGFLVGFLVIRSRKRDITLMRTVGVSQKAIFAQLLLEQLLCILSGIALGGSYTLWQPPQHQVLFGLVYNAGLCTALAVFLRRNLLTTIKEYE